MGKRTQKNGGGKKRNSIVYNALFGKKDAKIGIIDGSIESQQVASTFVKSKPPSEERLKSILSRLSRTSGLSKQYRTLRKSLGLRNPLASARIHNRSKSPSEKKSRSFTRKSRNLSNVVSLNDIDFMNVGPSSPK